MKRGDCYEASARFVREWPEETEVMLCHGIVTGRGKVEGIRFGHAWVEADWIGNGVCLELSNGQRIGMNRVRYYEMGQIDPSDVVRYSKRELLLMLAKHEHWGPWTPEHERKNIEAEQRAVAQEGKK